MEKLDWSTLPSNIIQTISFHLSNLGVKSLELCLVNKNWFKASLLSIYHSISIHDRWGTSYSRDRVLQKLKMFCHVLSTLSYNVGQYVKKFSCGKIINKHLDLLDIIIKHCPNIEDLDVPLYSGLTDHIVTMYDKKEEEEEDVVLWKNMRNMDYFPYYIKFTGGNSTYRCYYKFCNLILTSPWATCSHCVCSCSLLVSVIH